MPDKVNPFDHRQDGAGRLRVDPERSRRIKRIIVIVISILLLFSFVLPLAVGY